MLFDGLTLSNLEKQSALFVKIFNTFSSLWDAAPEDNEELREYDGVNDCVMYVTLVIRDVKQKMGEEFEAGTSLSAVNATACKFQR